MGSLSASAMVLVSGLQAGSQQQSRVGALRRVTKSASCCICPSEAAVFTASRLNASALRIIGPGSSFFTSGVGSLVAVDEFFVQPSNPQENPWTTQQAHCLTYFLEESPQDENCKESEVKAVKHGVQVLFQTSEKVGVDTGTQKEPLKLLSPNLHIREVASVETVFLGSGNDTGGAKVRVVAGQYENVSSPNEMNFVLLDILMRPGSTAKIPTNSSCGLIVYILEGVGIMKRDASVRPFYENEGHGIWFPPLSEDDKVLGNLLHVTCHSWSSLRFLVFEVEVS